MSTNTKGDKFTLSIEEQNTPFPTHDLDELLRRLPTANNIGEADPEYVIAIFKQLLPPNDADLARLVYDAWVKIVFGHSRKDSPAEVALSQYGPEAPHLLTARDFITYFTASLAEVTQEEPRVFSTMYGRMIHQFGPVINEIARRNLVMGWFLSDEDIKNEIWAQIPGFQRGIQVSNMGRVRALGGFPGLIYYSSALDAEAYAPRHQIGDLAMYGAYLATPIYFWDQHHPATDMMALRIEYLQELAFKNHPDYKDKIIEQPDHIPGKRWKRTWKHVQQYQNVPAWVDCRMSSWELDWYSVDQNPEYETPHVNYLKIIELPPITPNQWAQVNPSLNHVFEQMIRYRIEQERELERLKKEFGKNDDHGD